MGLFDAVRSRFFKPGQEEKELKRGQVPPGTPEITGWDEMGRYQRDLGDKISYNKARNRAELPEYIQVPINWRRFYK